MSVKSLTGFDANNQRIVAVASPSDTTDAVNKSYVDNLLDGLSWKRAVRVATTTAGTLASSFEEGDTVDTVTLVAGDRILIKDQVDETENGIYVVAETGAPTRASDANTTSELNRAAVAVVDGSVNLGKEYTQTTVDPNIGVDDIVWAEKGAGTPYTADGQGIEVAGNEFSLELDGSTLTKSGSGLRIGSGAAGAGLTQTAGVLAVGQGAGVTVGADEVAIDASVVVRKYAADCAATTNPQTFNHNLGTEDVAVTIVEASTDKVVLADVTVVDANNVSVNFGGAPSAAQYRVNVKA